MQRIAHIQEPRPAVDGVVREEMLPSPTPVHPSVTRIFGEAAVAGTGPLRLTPATAAMAGAKRRPTTRLLVEMSQSPRGGLLGLIHVLEAARGGAAEGVATCTVAAGTGELETTSGPALPNGTVAEAIRDVVETCPPSPIPATPSGETLGACTREGGEEAAEGVESALGLLAPLAVPPRGRGATGAPLVPQGGGARVGATRALGTMPRLTPIDEGPRTPKVGEDVATGALASRDVPARPVLVASSDGGEADDAASPTTPVALDVPETDTLTAPPLTVRVTAPGVPAILVPSGEGREVAPREGAPLRVLALRAATGASMVPRAIAATRGNGAALLARDAIPPRGLATATGDTREEIPALGPRQTSTEALGGLLLRLPGEVVAIAPTAVEEE